jgi:hypothetical protein
MWAQMHAACVHKPTHTLCLCHMHTHHIYTHSCLRVCTHAQPPSLSHAHSRTTFETKTLAQLLSAYPTPPHVPGPLVARRGDNQRRRRSGGQNPLPAGGMVRPQCRAGAYSAVLPTGSHPSTPAEDAGVCCSPGCTRGPLSLSCHHKRPPGAPVNAPVTWSTPGRPLFPQDDAVRLLHPGEALVRLC